MQYQYDSEADEFSYVEGVALDLESDFGSINEEDAFDGEFGYSLYQAIFLGDSHGRQTKRDVFLLACLQLYCGLPLFIISANEDHNYQFTPYFEYAKYGLTLLSLQYGVAITALLLGTLQMLAVYHWVSLVTNRELVVKLLKLLVGSVLVTFAVTLYCVSVLFLTFDGVQFRTSVQRNILVMWVNRVLLPFIEHLSFTLYISDIYKRLIVSHTPEQVYFYDNLHNAVPRGTVLVRVESSLASGRY
jgi:hypothetical protein